MEDKQKISIGFFIIVGELSDEVSSSNSRGRRLWAPTFEWINWEMLEFVGASDMPFADFVSIEPLKKNNRIVSQRKKIYHSSVLK